jgi:Mg2+/Co2+ transporter CorB
MAISMSPLFNRRATLKDALSLLLDSDVQTGIVVDRHGAMLGIVTADMIAERMRAGDHVVPAEPFPGDEPSAEADTMATDGYEPDPMAEVAG